MRNPLRLVRGGEAGTTLAFAVDRAGGDPLRLTLVVPEDKRLIPVAELVAAAREAPAWVREQSASLHEAADAAGAVVVGAICPDDDPGEVLVTLTVLFTENLADPVLEIPRYREGREPDGCIEQLVTRRGPTTSIVDRLYVLDALEPGGGPRPMLVQQWLVHTRFGGLAAVFTTVHPEGASGRMTGLYESIAESIAIAEPAPDRTRAAA